LDDDTPWTEVFRSPAREPCDERALVLLALGITSVLSGEQGAWALLVAPPDEPRALAELERYARENRPLPRSAPLLLHARLAAAASAAGYGLVLFLCGVASTRSLFGLDWFDAGVLDGAQFRAGEVWRAVTALTLHADLAHLAANAGFGALFGGLAARVYGAGAAWLLIVVAAGAANALEGLVMSARSASLGASTAVFAALGALTVHRRPAATRRARAGLAGSGIAAALVLLALLGTGDARTDIGAHALGFGFGMLLALPLRRWPAPRERAVQWLAGGAALALVGLAWAAAYWM